MFSSRFHWDLRPNRLTGLQDEKSRTGTRVLDLTESNPTHAGLVYPPGVVSVLADPRVLQYEPVAAGAAAARGAIARYYATVVQGLSVQARDGATRAELEAVITCAMAAWETLTSAPSYVGG